MTSHGPRGRAVPCARESEKTVLSRSPLSREETRLCSARAGIRPPRATPLRRTDAALNSRTLLTTDTPATRSKISACRFYTPASHARATSLSEKARCRDEAIQNTAVQTHALFPPLFRVSFGINVSANRPSLGQSKRLARASCGCPSPGLSPLCADPPLLSLQSASAGPLHACARLLPQA